MKQIQETSEKKRRRFPTRRTSAERIAHVERLQKAIQMRKSGFEFQQIADALGWNSRQAAQKAVAAVLDRVLLDSARELKLINLMRSSAPVLQTIQKGKVK